MSTSASSLNWWYMPGSFRMISSGVRFEAMSRKTPPWGDPRPSMTSRRIARATTSRVSSSGGRRAVGPLAGDDAGDPAVGLLLGLGELALEHVGDRAEHEPLAVLVLEHAALAADALGDQGPADAGRPDHPGRVELDELHVDQVGAGPEGHGVAVGGVFPGVRGDVPAAADAARGQHHRLGPEHDEPARSPASSRSRPAIRSPSFRSARSVHSMKTSMPWWTPRSWSVRIISRPVRSPTWASRG